MTSIDCEHCRFACWGYDDAYGAPIRFVEGCKREELGCIYDDDDRDDYPED